MMIARAALITALLIMSAPAYADDAPACADLPTQDEVNTCMFDTLQASSAKLAEILGRLRDEAKALDAKNESKTSLNDRLNQANLRFNNYLQETCGYLAARVGDEETRLTAFAAAYARCNQQIIDQRIELLTTQTAQ